MRRATAITEMALSAAEFKRLHMNRAAVRAAGRAVQARVAVGAADKPLKRDKDRLRDTWQRRGTNPGAYHNPNAEFSPLQPGANTKHKLY